MRKKRNCRTFYLIFITQSATEATQSFTESNNSVELCDFSVELCVTKNIHISKLRQSNLRHVRSSESAATIQKIFDLASYMILFSAKSHIKTIDLASYTILKCIIFP